jgi:hypothetical protein
MLQPGRAHLGSDRWLQSTNLDRFGPWTKLALKAEKESIGKLQTA